MKLCDTHVHSFRTFVGDKNMRLPNIAKRAEELGIDTVVITDHLMKGRDVEELRLMGNDVLAFRTSMPKTNVLFGVEVCEVNSQGLTLLDESLISNIALNLVIGGVHETHVAPGASLEEVARVQHAHHMMMMRNPLITILVHPWWFDKEEFDRLGLPWPEDLSFVPEELTRELGRASAETKTYIEISTMSGLCNRDTGDKFKASLREYYRILRDEGAYFAIGTDAHELSELNTIEEAVKLVRELEIPEDRFWQP